MQTSSPSQFIENIAALTGPQAHKELRTELDRVVDGETALILALTLISEGEYVDTSSEQAAAHLLNHANPLIQQLILIQQLQPLIIDSYSIKGKGQSQERVRAVQGHEYPVDFEVDLHEEAFPCFFDPKKEKRMRSQAERQIQRLQPTENTGYSQLATFTEAEETIGDYDSDESYDNETDEQITHRRLMRDTRRGTPSSSAAVSPGRFSSIAGVVARAFSPERFADPQKVVEAIDSQRRFLDAMDARVRALLERVTKTVIARYPGTDGQESSVKSLRNFSQFLIFLMADALMQLHQLLNQTQDEDLRTNPAHAQHIVEIDAAVRRLEKNLPLAEAVVIEQSQQTVEQFLRHLASTKRSLHPKGSVPVNNPMRARTDSNASVMHAAPNSSLRAIRDVLPIVESPVYPMPEYLAKAFRDSLANEIARAEKKISSDLTHSAEATGNKATMMKAGVTQLRAHLPLTLRDMYQIEARANVHVQGHIKNRQETLQAILTEQRGSGEASTFASTLATAGINFLAENPASLMRHYVFLTQLGAVAGFADDRNKDIHEAHLANTIAKMSQLRQAMLTLYSHDSSFSNITACMREMMTFATAHPDIEILVRLLLVACLDKLSDQAFTDLPRGIKLWLVGGDIADKQDFINTVAKNIENTPIVRKQGIRAWEKALLEITSFQQARYPEDSVSIFTTPRAYTALEHQIKIQAAVIHLGACVDHYFQAQAPLAADASVMDLTLFVENEANDTIENVPGADRKPHKTRLRLITNLKRHWQAALASNVNVGSITATTLALVNSGDEDALNHWYNALNKQKEHTKSQEIRANHLILENVVSKSLEKAIFFPCPSVLEAVNLENAIDYNNKFNEREMYYQAIINFVAVLLQHLKKDPGLEAIENENFDNIVKIAFAILDNLAGEGGVFYLYNEALLNYELSEILSILIREGETQIYTAQYLERELGLMNGGFYGKQAQKKLKDLIPDETTRARINEIKRKTDKVGELKRSIKNLKDLLMETCFPILRDTRGRPIKENGTLDTIESEFVTAEVSERIKRVRIALYGEPENIINPNVGPLFRNTFRQAKASNNDMFFIKALFTRAHHPINPPEYAEQLCLEIRDHYKETNTNLAAKWNALKERFYGNGDKLQALFAYYIPADNTNALAEEAITKALMIATFGFSNKKFAAHKLTFARKILLALAEFVRIEQTPEDIAEKVRAMATPLGEALEALVRASELISAEERRAIEALLSVAEKLKTPRDRKNFDVLYQRAEKHAVLCTKLHAAEMPTALLGLPFVDSEQHAMHVHRRRSAVASLRLDRPISMVRSVAVPVRAALRTPAVIQQEFDDIISGLVDGAFPILHRNTQSELRYFLRGERSNANKLDRNQLRQMLWGHIQMLQANNHDHIDSVVLQTAITNVYNEVDATFKNENQTKQWLFNKTNLAKRTVLEPVTSADKIFFGKQTLAHITQGLAKHLNDLVKEAENILQPVQRVQDEEGRDTEASVAPRASLSRRSNISEVSALPPAIITEAKIKNAVAVAEDWLLSEEEAPTVNNIPIQVRSLIDATRLTQLDIDRLRTQLKNAGAKSHFERRVDFLRAKRSDLCLEHIQENVRTTTEFEKFQENAGLSEIPVGVLNLLLEFSKEGYRKLKIVPSTYKQTEADLDSVTIIVKILDENNATAYWKASDGRVKYKTIEATAGDALGLWIERLLRVNGSVAELADATIEDLIERLASVGVLTSTSYELINEVATIFDCEHYHPDAELDVFIHELDQHAQDNDEYQPHLDEFIWSLAENAILSDEDEDSLLRLLKNAHGYDWNDLIFLGCKRYAAMSAVDRIHQKGPRLLKALVELAKPLTQFLDAEIEQIENLKFALGLLVRKSARHLSDDKVAEIVNAHIMNYLRGVVATNKVTEEIYNFIGGNNTEIRNDTFRSIKDDLKAAERPAEIEDIDEYFKLDNDNDNPRLQYAAYLSITTLKNEHITNDGADVYYHIYTLAQAWKRKLSESENSGVDLSEDAYTSAAPAQFSEISNNARDLLNDLHGELADHAFAEWHREILDVSKELPSSLDALIRHQPLIGADWQSKIEDSHNPDSLVDLNRIEAQPYYWETTYGIHRVYEQRFAYEAHALYELEMLDQMSVFEDKPLKTQYRDQNGVLQYQGNRRIEQQALAFMAAKYWYEDRNSQSVQTTAPFAEAIRSIAAARDCDPEGIIQNILIKACDSFNLMLNPGQDKIAHEKSYGLDRTKNVSLKREMMRWIKSKPDIARVYIERTKVTGIHCEEQANFVLDLLKGSAPESVPVTNRAVSVENTYSSMFTTPLSSRRSEVASSSRMISSASHSVMRSGARKTESKPANVVDKQALLFQAFDWKYAYINAGISRSRFVTSEVKPRLEDFVIQINQYSLWQEYYAYVASHQKCNAVNIARFANYEDPAAGPYLVDHANILWDAMKENPCKNGENLTYVTAYIFQSWCTAIDAVGIDKFLSKADRPRFYRDVFYVCVEWFNGKALFTQSEWRTIEKPLQECDSTEKEAKQALLEKSWDTYDRVVPPNIKSLFEEFAKKLDVSVKPGYKPPTAGVGVVEITVRDSMGRQIEPITNPMYPPRSASVSSEDLPMVAPVYSATTNHNTIFGNNAASASVDRDDIRRDSNGGPIATI